MILVTGGTGFVGQQIVKSLLRVDHDIIVLVRKGSLNPFDKEKKVKIITSEDIFAENEAWWSKVIQNVDTIVHSAWYAKPKTYLNSLENLKCLNGTIIMAKAILKSEVSKFIGIGSCLEYEKSLIPKTVLPTNLFTVGHTACKPIAPPENNISSLISIRFLSCSSFL